MVSEDILGNGIRVNIYSDPARWTTNLIFYYKINDKIFVAKPVLFEFEELKEFDAPEPTIKLTGRNNSVLKDIAEELDREGVKTESDSKLEGKFEIMERYLADMRIFAGLEDKKE